MDKQVYFERRWTVCELFAQKGTTVVVRLSCGAEIRVPFQHVRDLDAECKECGKLLWGSSSYQAHSGDSYCRKCYDKMDNESISLLFGGHQWISWDGQISIRDMDDDHLINTLGFLRKNAEKAAELTGGTPDQHLNGHFPHLVDELRRRRPEDIGSVKMNSMLLAMWAVIMTVLIRVGYRFPTDVKAEEPKRSPKAPSTKSKTKPRQQRKKRKRAPVEPKVPW
jgi:hypothetical protein